jgi:hypothetical protein
MHGVERNAYMTLAVKTEGKRPLGRSGETLCGGMEWINLAQDRNQWKTLVNVMMNL